MADHFMFPLKLGFENWNYMMYGSILAVTLRISFYYQKTNACSSFAKTIFLKERIPQLSKKYTLISAKLNKKNHSHRLHILLVTLKTCLPLKPVTSFLKHFYPVHHHRVEQIRLIFDLFLLKNFSENKS